MQLLGEALNKSGIPRKKMEQISNISPDNYVPEDLQLISGSLQKYTNAYNNKQGKKTPVGKMILGLLTSPDYKLKDFKAIMINGYQKNTSLWKEILKIDLTDALKKATIPYVIIQGDTDVVASTTIVREVIANANNSNLGFVIIKNSGHFPSEDMMETVYDELIRLSE